MSSLKVWAQILRMSFLHSMGFRKPKGQPRFEEEEIDFMSWYKEQRVHTGEEELTAVIAGDCLSWWHTRISTLPC